MAWKWVRKNILTWANKRIMSSLLQMIVVISRFYTWHFDVAVHV